MKQINDYILQDNTFDCGIASLLTIFSYYNILASKEDVISIVNYSNEGISAYDLIKASKYYNLSAKGVKTSIDMLEKTNFPCIAHIVNDEGYYHYIVIIDKSDKTIKAMDPAYGIVYIDNDDFFHKSTGVFILFDKSINSHNKDNRFKKFIFNIFKEEKKLLIKMLFLSLFVVCLTIMSDYFLKIIFDYLNYDNKYIYLICVIFLFIVVFKNCFDYIKKIITLKIANNCDNKINHDVVEHIINLPYKYYSNRNTGEIVSVINDIEYFKDIVMKIFVTLVIDLILLFIILIYLSFYSVFYSLIIILFIIILSFITQKFKYKFNDNFVRLKSSKIKYSSKLIDVISSFESIKNLHSEKNSSNKLYSSYKDVLNNNKEYLNVFNKYSFISNFTADLFYIIIIFISSLIFSKSGYSNIILFSSIFYTINSLVVDISDILVMYKIYDSSIKRILDVLDIKEENFQKTNMHLINTIFYDNVCYEEGNNNILSNVNLEIKRGDKLFITGDSGCGKSTMMKLLLNYLQPSSGSIYIDNINIKDLSLEFLRSNITYISQNEYLYNDSIINNLKIVDCSEEDIEMVNKIVGLDKIVSDLSFVIEENGKNLSGGERKKIIIARALLHFKEVIIFDEAFNEIDIEEERKILENIFKYYPNKIYIMISHRKDNCNMFDKKYELRG